MSVIDRGLDSLTFLTDRGREALRRRLRELAGAALIIIAMLIAAALATWSVQDPSLSHATNAPVRNLLGITGATVSDLMMQLLGVSSVALLLPVAIWGWRLAGHRPLAREPLRIAAWIIGVALAASFASSLPRSAAWPLPAGLGGVVGDALLRVPPRLLGHPLVGLGRAMFAAATGFLATMLLALASGFAWHGHSGATADSVDGMHEEERSSISLGWIVHGLLSLKARLGRLIRRRTSAGISLRRDAGKIQSGRAEPRFDNYQSVLRDLEHEPIEEADEDDEEDEEPKARTRGRSRAAGSRRSRGGYVFPPLDVLAAPRSVGRAPLSEEALQENATALE